MTHDSLLNRDWDFVVKRLGGADALEAGARATRAFMRPRAVKCAADMLRLVLAYCLGDGGLRSVAKWATAVGLVDISNVGLLYRPRRHRVRVRCKFALYRSLAPGRTINARPCHSQPPIPNEGP